MSTTVTDVYWDPWEREIYDAPHALYRRLRDEEPLYHNDRHGFYAISRYDDAERMLQDRETFISGKGVTIGIIKSGMTIPPGTVIFEDPPTHTIHRKLLSRMFTARNLSGLEDRIRLLCSDILDQLVGTGELDFAADLGMVVPMRVIGMLIGIPVEDQTAIRDSFGGGGNNQKPRDEVLNGERFAEYVDWRADHPSDDIMTQLLHAEFTDASGEQRCLTREEVLSYVNIVNAAGNETTLLLIGWAGKLLAEHPDQRRMLADDPSLIPAAVDEILRFEAPKLQSARYVTRDVELHGRTVPEGSTMVLLLGSANRDERQHADADRFDITRDTGQLLSFGFGSHYCLGQALARLEGRVVLEEVLTRFADWNVDWERAEFGYTAPELRGYTKLPVFTG